MPDILSTVCNCVSWGRYLEVGEIAQFHPFLLDSPGKGLATAAKTPHGKPQISGFTVTNIYSLLFGLQVSCNSARSTRIARVWLPSVGQIHLEASGYPGSCQPHKRPCQTTNVPLAKASHSQAPKSVVWGSLLYFGGEVLQCYNTKVCVYITPLQEWGQELGRMTWFHHKYGTYSTLNWSFLNQDDKQESRQKERKRREIFKS